jgi:glutamate-1-semialdehyde 2,1-aminomutase
MDVFNPAAAADFVFHSGTFNGNNMTMTAGLAAMQRLDQAAIERINGLGESLGDGVNRIFQSLGIRAQCLGYGSLQQIHWTDAPVVSLADARRAGEDIGQLRQLLQLELLNRGVYTSNRGMFSISTPVNEDDIALALAAVEGALDSLRPYMRATAPRLLRD